MTYDVLDVDPDLYVEAGDRARRAARQIREAVDSAVAAHSGSHNAAGKGDAGLLDPNVARLRERLNESVVDAGRDRLGK